MCVHNRTMLLDFLGIVTNQHADKAEGIREAMERLHICIRAWQEQDLKQMSAIWNEVVEEGRAFPQEEQLDDAMGAGFFASQSYCGVAEDEVTGKLVGLYILHPNHMGRCGHICNASYAVATLYRGRHIGEKLVTDCMEQGRRLGFRILQFNAVVAENIHARHLYERLGFHQLGTIPGGFRCEDGTYADICPYYIEL